MVVAVALLTALALLTPLAPLILPDRSQMHPTG